VDQSTREAIVANAHKLSRIAPERIAAELRTMLAAPTRVAALDLLDGLHLSEVVFRTLPASHRRTSTYVALLPGEASFANVMAAAVLARFDRPAAALAPAAVKKVDAEFRHTLKLSNDELLAIRTTLDVGSLLLDEAMPGVPAMKRYLARPHADDGRRLLATLIDDADLGLRAAAVEAAFASFAPETVAPPPFVTGDDLQSLGYAPGPAFKVALDTAYDAQLDGSVTSRDAALSLARDRMARVARPAPGGRSA
jgi:hypothetical protein